MDLSTDHVRLLAELGLIAVGEGRLEEAAAITDAVAAYRPNEVAVYVARALIELRRGKPEDAVRLLESDALANHPGNPMLQTFLGMALMAAGYGARARGILETMALQQTDMKAAALAQSLKALDQGGKEARP
ncbi:MAG: tetratricopeptide repeat protein [Candidatus Hydrogenedentes bacterium]|nr:tetratricopeptide repeat protein [Candidatus Hydrogenedentota bacterium]